MAPQHRRGIVEILGGLGSLWLFTTAAASEGLSAELLTVAGVTAIFVCGMGYADIRSQASSAHRRLDERRRDDETAQHAMSERLERISESISHLTIAVERAGIQVFRGPTA